MLKKLHIQNYAIIDEIEIDFSGKLNMITGETGAGKSILMGALSLILGDRADTTALLNRDRKCFVEGTFAIEGKKEVKAFFKEHDLDAEEELVIRREIGANGKSRAFVNDTPVNLTSLKQLGEKLIDIHSQHATLEINDPEFQLLVVDSVAKHDDLLNEYRTKYRAFKKDTGKLAQLIAESDKAKADLDYFQFQFDELEKVSLAADEQEPLEKELYALNNAEEIKRNLYGAYYLVQESETAALAQLREAGQQLGSIEKFDTQIEELHQRLNSAIIELKDIAAEIEGIEQKTHTNDARVDEINTRLSLIYNLQKKHRVNSNTELLQIQDDLSEKIQQALFGDETIEKLQQQLAADKAGLEKLAGKLTANRLKAIPAIEKQVIDTLAEMGMGSSVLKIEQTPPPPPKGGAFDLQGGGVLSENGVDHVRFLFSANKGHALAEMSKVASGGELSRLMLSIKSIIAKYTALPTIIFDEIDTGVSGEVANKVGTIMERLADNLQVITITHLPQIASKGKNHYFVYKDDSAATTYTRMKQLDARERILEIAKMLSGDKPGESALQNARELLDSIK